MADLTANGVCYDLAGSPFVAEVLGFRFHFSSKTHYRKFLSTVRIKREWLDDSLMRRFKYDFQASELAAFQLYRNVETRGFYVVKPDGTVMDNAREASFSVKVD